ncbi:Rha family transcriptional regulator [Pseudomonas sp. GG8]
MQVMTNSNTPAKSATRFLQTQNVSRTISMTSLELVDFLNGTRQEIGDGSVLRHDHFMVKVPKVLKKDAPKFRDIYKDAQNRTQDCYRFPKREACLMAMSYSYELQAAVFDYMTELESKIAQPVALPSYAETLRLYADQIEQTAVLQIANIQQAKKIESLEHLFMAGETPSQFVKRLNGVNAQKINATLLELGWIYNAESEPDRSPKYRTTSKARSQLLLTERPRKIDGEGFDKPFIRYDLQMLESGATKLHNLYLDLRLTMKKTWDQQFFYAKFAEEAPQ